MGPGNGALVYPANFPLPSWAALLMKEGAGAKGALRASVARAQAFHTAQQAGLPHITIGWRVDMHLKAHTRSRAGARSCAFAFFVWCLFSLPRRSDLLFFPGPRHAFNVVCVRGADLRPRGSMRGSASRSVLALRATGDPDREQRPA